MSSPLLKGNYPLADQPTAAEHEAPDLEQTFEQSALAKLGGSIAFVKLPSGFVWKGPKSGPKSR